MEEKMHHLPWMGFADPCSPFRLFLDLPDSFSPLNQAEGKGTEMCENMTGKKLYPLYLLQSGKKKDLEALQIFFTP